MAKNKSSLDNIAEQIAGLSPAKRALLELKLKEKLGDVSKNRGDGLRLPTVTPDPARRYEPFPLSDIQQAYWIGRNPNLELGGVATHIYWEFDGQGLDLTRLSHAWQRLIERHEMLRAVILPDGQQQILKHVPPYQIAVLDLRGKAADEVAVELERVRAEMSHQVRQADRWPLFEVRASLLDGDRHRLHASFDFLILDGWSISILSHEWQQLYRDPQTTLPPLELSFRDYVLVERAIKETDLYRRSQQYWWNRLDDLPSAPELPLAKNPQTVKRPKFVRRETQLSSDSWQRIKNRAAQEGLTPTAVLLACFAQALALWSRSAKFTLNLTLFNRLPLHPQVNDIVGDFTSLVLLAVDCSTTGSFAERARRLQQQLTKDLNYRYVSGVEVLRELARRQTGKPKALLPVVFTSLLTRPGRARERQTEWLGESGYSISQTPQVWIDSVASETKGSVLLRWDAVDELFPAGLLDDMFAAYGRLVNRLAEEPACWEADEVEIRHTLMPTWQVEQRATVNATDRAVSDEFLHTLFESQVAERPDQPAVIASNGTLTYEQLARRANQVGRRLRERGAKPNTLVAVVMEKGWEQVVAVLGVLASGAAYLPIDPTLPRERLWYLLKHGEVGFALTQPCFNETLDWPGDVERLCVNADQLGGVDDRALAPVQSPDDLAYVIYTSGSTGQPKGVMIEHRAAVNTILDINERFRVGPRDRVLALSSLGFDLSVYDIFGTLAAGGAIIMPEADKVRDPAHWADLIRRHEVTVWDSVPALMKLLVEYVDERPELWPRSLRLVLLSGDWIPVGLPEQIKAKVEAVKVISLGGATEASIWSILYPIERVDPSWTSIPYGRPMINQRFHVLDERMLPCPVWAPGQLYIGGVGLARGYWRDEEKTNASFITHPHTGERLYRTGDLGRYLPDGNIEFLGREDFQVKIQGYRVELGEVEAALEQHPKIKTAVVTTIGESRGEKRLAAYVVSENGETVAATHLQEFLEAKLPAYMVPSLFVTLDRLPLTPNGKVDRRALPPPLAVSDDKLRQTTDERPHPTTRIAEIAAGVLKLNEVAADANLLRLGATSVDIIRILNRVERELGFRPTMDAFYREPTALALARAYQQERRAGEAKAKAKQPADEATLARADLILDPDAREAFKNTQPGLRRDDGQRSIVTLPTAALDETERKLYEQRRSHRRFSRQPVTPTQLSRLLGCLRQIELNGKPKYLYGSAGGLYPVQTYIYIKPERASGISTGVYYYHPVEHRLVVMSRDAVIEPEVYDRLINRPIFDEAAFAVFFIAQMKAITPMYGEWSTHFATIEAGLMAQLLEMTAPACGLGLCQIGVVDFARVREWFRLEESHVLVHSLLGGVVDESHPWTPTSEAAAPPMTVLDEREEGEI